MDSAIDRIPTGVSGFDEIVDGGLLEHHNYLVRGGPGAGKSTFGIHFLSEGVSQDEATLYINLGEKRSTIERVAANFGFPIDEVDILDLAPSGDEFVEEAGYDIFSSAEVERQPLTDEIAQAVSDTSPDRVFVDPVTQLRYLTPDEYQFRKQLLSLLRFLTDNDATVLFSSQRTAVEPDDDLQFLSDGIVTLDHDGRRRTVEVTKLRGSDYTGGAHSFDITDAGIEVYPTLPVVRDVEPSEHGTHQLSLGIPELDRLLGGGLERGTTTYVTGPSGVGKSTLGSIFMKEAAGRGERSNLYLFEESVDTLVHRSRAINVPIDEMRDRGTLMIEPIETLAMDTNQFAARVKSDVEDHGTDIVMIDGVEGYKQAAQEGDPLQPLHRLVRYLSSEGVTTLLIAETKEITGEFKVSEFGGTYLADNVVFLQHVELEGELRKTIGVLKKRMSGFERMLREFRITEHGLRIGDPMTDLRGVLTGTPEFAEGVDPQLMETE